MRIPVPLKLAVLTVGATGFYTYVGQMVPQKEVHPPEVVEISEDISTEDMVTVGEEIFAGKGICTTCHTIGKTSGPLRFPDLAGIGQRAATRIDGLSAVAYLAQSLYEPDVYVVPGFNPGMPQIDRPPVGLTTEEILTVIAYLQSLGGEPTVTMETVLVDADGRVITGDAGDSTPAAEVAPASGGALELRGCTACHDTDRPKSGIGEGPSLADVGRRLDRDRLLLETVNHPVGAGGPFVKQLSIEEVETLVAAMAELQG